MLSLRQNKRSVFSRTCAGKRHPESRERGDRKGANGGKREGERSEQESVVPRQKGGGHAPGKDTQRAANAATKVGVNGGENRGIHERDPCRLTWAISGDFRLVVLGILLYSCVLRTKTRSKIAPWQVQRSFARRICAKAMKRPQTIRSLLARALKMHRCKSVGQNRHVSLPCMP